VTPIVPPATIGMLGGGQLGRFAILAANEMGYRTIVVDPSPDAPAGAVADEHLVASYDDPVAIARLGEQCSVVTTEFENPPASTLTELAAVTRVAPNAGAVAIAQDRRREKGFLVERGVPVGSFAVIDDETDIGSATGAVPFPAVLKTARLGYDGKGQVTVSDASAVPRAWRHLGAVPCVLEQRLHLDAEVSVVLARSVDGEVAPFQVGDNVHVDGILDVTVVPARIHPHLIASAIGIAGQIAAVLDYVGTLGVEFFVVGDEVLVNELAPRPHNSGHWTLDGAATDQFTQQVRAVCGLSLGSAEMTVPAAAMVNVLGDLWANGEPKWDAARSDPAVRLHLYGKSEPRPGRKMGHITAIASTPNAAEAAALAARARL
jgi:5-(carboxyamino)imidazole ribonucleotide synthase